MTVKEILKKYLDDNGYDGLAGDECGCKKEDMFLCESSPEYCKPGYLYEDAEGEWIIYGDKINPEITFQGCAFKRKVKEAGK